MLMKGVERRGEGYLRGFQRRPRFYFYRGRIYCRGWEYLRWRSEPLTGMCARHGIALLLHHDNHDRDLPFIGQAHEVA